VKVRLRFSKLGRIRWTSHRDVARLWERALRRARIPLSYSAGFSPHPLLSFGLALPTGCESTAEYLDVSLATALDPAEVVDRLAPVLVPGLTVVGAGTLAERAASLQEEVSSCTWVIDVPDVSVAVVSEVSERLLAADAIPVRRARKGRMEVDDLRPSLRALAARPGPSGGAVLDCELGTRPRGVRPVELEQVLGFSLGPARRTCQWIERDGSRWEPLTSDAPMVAGVVGRAR